MRLWMLQRFQAFAFEKNVDNGGGSEGDKGGIKLIVKCRIQESRRDPILSAEAFQKEESTYSELVAKDLTVPYLKTNPFIDREIVFEFTEKLLSKGSL